MKSKSSLNQKSNQSQKPKPNLSLNPNLKQKKDQLLKNSNFRVIIFNVQIIGLKKTSDLNTILHRIS